MIKVIDFKKLRGDKKKYQIKFKKNGKEYIRKFGAQGMSDFTIHKDRNRRERYISRHKKDLRTKNPMAPGYLSMYILWNKPSIEASLKDYKRRLNVYNRTGKFPLKITGSKLLKFGTIPFKETSLRKLPEDVQNIIQRDVSASNIQRIQRGRKVRKLPENMMTKKYLKDLLLRMNIDDWSIYLTSPNNNGIWEILDPTQASTATWLFYAADILTAKDFDDNDLWYNCINQVIEMYVELDPDNTRYLYIPGQDLVETDRNLRISAENMEVILKKLGYTGDTDDEGWYFEAEKWLEKWASGNAFGRINTTGGSRIPDNVVNKKLYASIKAKIKKSIKGRRWGAYDSGRLVREYKAKGGKYKGSKAKTDLGRWYKEKWVDACEWPKKKACGRKTAEKIAYCRPSKRVDSKTPKLVQELTKAQIKRRCAQKKKTPMRIVRSSARTNKK